MCNRFVQKGREVRPQQNATVLIKGPGGFFELPFEAVFGGPARNESRNYWIKREGAEPVIVPDIERFGEKDKTTGRQNWEEVPLGTAMEGLLLPTPPGKEYRLLKVVTQCANSDQLARLGNDRVPVLRLPEETPPGTTSPSFSAIPPVSDGPSKSTVLFRSLGTIKIRPTGQ
jgi:hypothetical protein